MMAARHVPLHDVATIERDIVEPFQIKAGTLFVGLENIGSGGRFVNVRPVGSGELASSKFAFTPRHVLYGKLRPYLAKIARPDFAGICSTDILPVLPGPELDRDYLAWLLLTPEMISLAASRATGANLPRLSPNALADMKIPLPPLPEQRRIAEILGRAEALRAKRRAALAELDTLTQSVFLEMCGDPARNTRGLKTMALAELGEWQSGGTPPRTRSEYFKVDGSGIPWFSSGELNGMYATRSLETITEDALSQTSAKRVPCGSLMLGMYDTAALKGSLAAVDCSCNQAVAFVKIDEAVAHPVFVYFAIAVGREHFRRLQRGVRQKNLNLSMVREIRIPRPAIEQQQQFAAVVERIRALRDVHDIAESAGNSLFASIQQRAFRGEL